MNYLYKLCIIFISGSLIFFYNTQGTVYIIPPGGFEKGDAFFNLNERDECLKAFHDLREALKKLGYKVAITTLEKTIDDITCILAYNTPCYRHTFQRLPLYNQEKLILFLSEPPTVSPRNYNINFHALFSLVYTMLDDLIDNKKYFKFYYPQPRLVMISDRVNFNEKKLCTLISCNKSSSHPYELYSKRLSTIRFFEQRAPQDFDLYGVGWNSQEFPNYRGQISTKKDILKTYKFCICYENMCKVNGYITEKIFDCFVAGCVPIYWGAQNITNYIPKNCFIDQRDFATLDELYHYIKNMDQEAYKIYIQNIRTFLSSDKAFLFSIEHYIDTIVSAIEPHYDKTLIFSDEQINKLARIKDNI